HARLPTARPGAHKPNPRNSSHVPRQPLLAGIGHNLAKLPNAERSATVSDALLPEEDGPTVFGLHENRDHGQQRCKDYQPGAGGHEVEGTLRSGHRRCLRTISNTASMTSATS